MVGVCYRLLHQDEDTYEAFYRHLAEIALSSSLVLIGDFNFPNKCRKYSAEAAVKEAVRICGRQLPDVAGKRAYQGSAPLDLLFTKVWWERWGLGSVLHRVITKW